MINNKIYNMDCFKGLESMENGVVDLVITDPPYNVDYTKKSVHLSKMKKDKRQDKSERDKFFKDSGFDKYDVLASELYRVTKDNCHAYIFCAERQISIWIKEMETAGWKFGGLLIWLKNAQTFDLSCGYKYAYKTENILFFRKGNKKLNKLGLNNVFEFKRGVSLKHPCEKPAGLIRELIKNSSQEGDLVLDCFMGSGSTAVASKQLKRDYIGFELAREYCTLINTRLEQNTLFSWR